MVAHAATALVAVAILTLNLLGAPIMPVEAGLGGWSVVLPFLAMVESLLGFLFLWWRPGASLIACRAWVVAQFGTLAVAGGIARFLVLASPNGDSSDLRFSGLLDRFDSVITNFPFVFGVILYGILIPNSPRRSLAGALLICSIPFVATFAAAAVNPDVRPTIPGILPITILPLFMAVVVAVFSADRQTALRREAFEARREADELGAYRLLRKLGEGGMGEVWLAEHRLLKRPCAVKFVRAELAAQRAIAARFEREVKAVTGLTHFNTVRIYDYGRADDGTFYYVMEYLDGPTLDRLVRDYGPLSPARAIYLLRQLCGALAEAHAAGLVHRDLKPGNIIVATLGGQHDIAKLLDFGLVHDVSSSVDGRLTQTGTVLGTPAYMCPEQAGGEHVDARSDLYSLGAVAFLMLTCRPPFEGSNVGKLLSAHLTQPAPLVTAIRADVPADLTRVVARCLAKDPAARYQSAGELEAALAACECADRWSPAEAATWWAAPTPYVPDPAYAGPWTETVVRA
jgi:serine/threonine-protein kinase